MLFMAVPFASLCVSRMAEPFCANITYSAYSWPCHLLLCDLNMAEPFLRKNYSRCLMVFMAAPFADFAF